MFIPVLTLLVMSVAGAISIAATSDDAVYINFLAPFPVTVTAEVFTCTSSTLPAFDETSTATVGAVSIDAKTTAVITDKNSFATKTSASAAIPSLD